MASFEGSFYDASSGTPSLNYYNTGSGNNTGVTVNLNTDFTWISNTPEKPLKQPFIYELAQKNKKPEGLKYGIVTINNTDGTMHYKLKPDIGNAYNGLYDDFYINVMLPTGPLGVPILYIELLSKVVF